jgi:hypothetical protein
MLTSALEADGRPAAGKEVERLSAILETFQKLDDEGKSQQYVTEMTRVANAAIKFARKQAWSLTRSF